MGEIFFFFCIYVFLYHMEFFFFFLTSTCLDFNQGKVYQQNLCCCWDYAPFNFYYFLYLSSQIILRWGKVTLCMRAPGVKRRAPDCSVGLHFPLSKDRTVSFLPISAGAGCRVTNRATLCGTEGCPETWHC